MGTIKTLLAVVLSLLSLEICPTYTPTSPVVRQRIESTRNARRAKGVACCKRLGMATAHTVVVSGSGPATEAPVTVRIKRRVGV